ncbi:MAG: DUF6504 family protein [candidate division WOR-3 bacterium]|nr:DUF6504 family protein [candidate division WOR-3 bacterium]
MNYQTVNEPITVDCLFKNPGILPKMFVWRNRVYHIINVNGQWQRREGKFLVYYFAVSDEHGNCYEIEFDSKDMKWQLLKVAFE